MSCNALCDELETLKEELRIKDNYHKAFIRRLRDFLELNSGLKEQVETQATIDKMREDFHKLLGVKIQLDEKVNGLENTRRVLEDRNKTLHKEILRLRDELLRVKKEGDKAVEQLQNLISSLKSSLNHYSAMT